MKASELRVGNYLYDYDDKPIRITGIAHDLNNYGGYFLQFGENHSGLIMLDEDEPQYPPIPLTPETLKKCGFEYLQGDVAKWMHFKSLIRLVVSGDKPGQYFLGSFSGSKDMCYIKHLHQLQNLYYTLTNEELEINL